MKQSEYKERLEYIRKMVELNSKMPFIFNIIRCKNKKYSTSGCTCCWYCENCGRLGCDNLLGLKENDTVKEVNCDLEEG